MSAMPQASLCTGAPAPPEGEDPGPMKHPIKCDARSPGLSFVSGRTRVGAEEGPPAPAEAPGHVSASNSWPPPFHSLPGGLVPQGHPLPAQVWIHGSQFDSMVRRTLPTLSLCPSPLFYHNLHRPFSKSVSSSVGLNEIWAPGEPSLSCDTSQRRGARQASSTCDPVNTPCTMVPLQSWPVSSEAAC